MPEPASPPPASSLAGKPVYLAIGAAGFGLCLVATIILVALGLVDEAIWTGVACVLFGIVYPSVSLVRREGRHQLALALLMASALAIAAAAGWIAWQNITLSSQIQQPAVPEP